MAFLCWRCIHGSENMPRAKSGYKITSYLQVMAKKNCNHSILIGLCNCNIQFMYCICFLLSVGVPGDDCRESTFLTLYV